MYVALANVFSQRGASFLSDQEVMNLVASRNILNYKLETVLETPERGVAVRREILSAKLPVRSALSHLPYKDYDYSQVLAPPPSSLPSASSELENKLTKKYSNIIGLLRICLNVLMGPNIHIAMLIFGYMALGHFNLIKVILIVIDKLSKSGTCTMEKCFSGDPIPCRTTR